MKDTKDNFSHQSNSYANYRPSYPSMLFDWLYSQCNSFDVAWDCATGNGQAANNIAREFKLVYATDISISQLENSKTKENINYICERAEQTSFADNSFNLITVAQSLHWFDHDAYFDEVNRVAKNRCVFAAWGYSLPRINTEIDKVVDDFYINVVGEYWDAERRYVDEQYVNIDIPFDALPSPKFSISYNWTIEQFLGYIGTWSAVQHYMKQNGNSPITILREQLCTIWSTEKLEVTFPIFMRAYIIKK